MEFSKPIGSPMLTTHLLSASDGNDYHSPFLYKSMVGALQYITLIRLDISYAVNKTCQFMS